MLVKMACAWLVVLLLDVSVANAQLGPSQQELDNASSNTRDWLYATHNYTGQRIGVKQITPANARRLQEMCVWPPTDTGPAQTSHWCIAG